MYSTLYSIHKYYMFAQPLLKILQVKEWRESDVVSFPNTILVCLHSQPWYLLSKFCLKLTLTCLQNYYFKTKQVSSELGIDSETLAQYADRFKDHNITGQHLFTLTEHDLQNMGIASIGHQRKILVHNQYIIGFVFVRLQFLIDFDLLCIGPVEETRRRQRAT